MFIYICLKINHKAFWMCYTL